ncbi:MAG: CotH kinase family protein [Bacteroidota bacterium]|nr:CotH kinase family protein [Bacteroidota bacterium]
MILTGSIALLSLILGIKYSASQKVIFKKPVLDKKLIPPVCNMESGFYTSEFPVLLSSPENLPIYFTLDGTSPTRSSSVYSAPILITGGAMNEAPLSYISTSPRWKPPLNDVFSGIVIRASTFGPGNTKSNELIRSFFIEHDKRAYENLPVVSLVVEPDDFFGYENGIYVLGENYEDKDLYLRKNLRLDLPWWKYPSNYMKKGANADRKVFVEWFEPGYKFGFSKRARIRINGNATRGFSQKSLRLSFDKNEAGPLLYRIFPENTISSYSSIIMRNGGNDWDKTMFRDVLMQSLMSGSAVKTLVYRPAVVFINGEFWGLHNISERMDEDYISNHFHLSRDSVVILEVNGGKLGGTKKSEISGFEDLVSFVSKNDMSQEASYKYVEERIEMNSFMDMIISNVYFSNSDWPANNVKFWRYRGKNNFSHPESDGKWRWMLYDTDWGFGYTGKGAVNVNLLDKVRKSAYIGVIFGGLLKNPEFSRNFVERFRSHMTVRFNKTLVIEQINKLEETFAPCMQEHIDRWREIGSYYKWKAYVQELRDFAEQRPLIQEEHLKALVKKEAK